MLCRTCKRPLGNPDDPLSKDFGGDCLQCMAVIADDPDAQAEVERIALEQIEAKLQENACPNCGEPGDPKHHWLSQPGVYEGYVCFGKDVDATAP